MIVTILENDAGVPPGHLERVCRERGHDVEIVRLHQGDELPSIEAVDAVVSLGGAMGAYDDGVHPYLADEMGFLVDAVEHGIPVLGICLGCQLLAKALGGEVYLAPKPEVGLLTLEVLESHAPEAILGSRPTHVMHQDTWTLPDGARLTARTDRYNQAFRLGSALGVQTHPEVTSEVATEWLSDPRGVELVARAGGSATAHLDDLLSAEADLHETADQFFGAWLDEAEAAV